MTRSKHSKHVYGLWEFARWEKKSSVSVDDTTRCETAQEGSRLSTCGSPSLLAAQSVRGGGRWMRMCWQNESWCNILSKQDVFNKQSGWLKAYTENQVIHSHSSLNIGTPIKLRWSSPPRGYAWDNICQNWHFCVTEVTQKWLNKWDSSSLHEAQQSHYDSLWALSAKVRNTC